MRGERLAGVLVAVLAAGSAGLLAWPADGRTADRFRLLRIAGEQVRWRPDPQSQPLALTYAFITAPLTIPNAVNCHRMQPAHALAAAAGLGMDDLRRVARRAFDRWQREAGLQFTETADAAGANIVIGAQAVPTGQAFTNLQLGAVVASGARAIERAAICLNPERSWKIGFDGNLASYDLTHTLTHEIGHAIGLDHPGPRGHAMSFRYDEASNGLSDGDAEGARAIYGPPLAWRPRSSASLAAAPGGDF